MPKEQRTFTKEFKLEAVQLVQRSGKSQAQVARELGIADSTLHHWGKLFADHGQQAFVASRASDATGRGTAAREAGTGGDAAGAGYSKKGHALTGTTANEQRYTVEERSPTSGRNCSLDKHPNLAKKMSRVS